MTYVTNNFRLPGQYFDSESGLSNNFQRNYDSALGAYIEHDPYGVLVTGANRYVYGGGDPVNLYDPTGEIVPIIVGVVWVASAVYTGFEVYQCYEYIRDGCQDPTLGESCENAFYGAVVGFGIGKGIQVVGRLGKFGAPWLRRYGDDGIRNLKRILDSQRRFPVRVTDDFLRKTNSFNPFRRNPMDLTEQLTLAEAKAGAGKPIERLSNLRDPKFRSMSKYEHAHDRSDGSKVVIHYVKDPFGKTTDFKFIDK